MSQHSIGVKVALGDDDHTESTVTSTDSSALGELNTSGQRKCKKNKKGFSLFRFLTKSNKKNYQNRHSRRERTICFDKVQVREYERTVGDHPCVRDMGAPLSLGWSYLPEIEEYSIEDHQKHCNRRRGKFFIPSMDRDAILADWGFSEDELYHAIMEVGKVRYYREETLMEVIANGKLEDVKVVMEIMSTEAQKKVQRQGEAERRKQEQELEQALSANMSRWKMSSFNNGASAR